MAKPRGKHQLTGTASPKVEQAAGRKEASRPNEQRPLRVLALDGGPAALLVVLMLSEVEDRVPGFLENVDVIAGTSAGAISGLMLATKANPAEMLPVAENFWRNPQDYYKNSLFGYLRALVGMGPFNDAQYVRKFLEQPGVLADRRLRDLAKYVIITSFDISAGQVISATRPPLNWRPKVFQNLSPDGIDMELHAVDAAMCSSASPITTAVQMGKVDGGLIANNPAMVAVGQVFAEGVRPTTLSARFPTDYHGIQMLSVGGGRSGEAFAVRNANWGYFKWLLDPSNLLLLLNGFLSGTAEAISMQSGQILNESKFRRLDPFYIERGLLPFVQADPKKQQATADSTLTQEMVEETAAWLRRTGWVDESKPVTAAVAVA